MAYANSLGETGAAAPRAGERLGALWLALATIAAGVFFWDGIADLWSAWQTPEYSHGLLIPVISLYLFLRQTKHVPPNHGPVTDRWPGVAVLMVALAIGLFGNITQIEKITSLAIIVWVGGMVLTSFGWARGKQFWPPVLHLAFMLPLPFFLYWQVSIALQLISSEIGVWFIQLAGVPVFLEGNIIDLGVWKLHVAEACSGLRYLFPILSFTYLFAVLYQGSMWHKAILLTAAVPIAILMNSIRIGVIGVMVDAYGIEHAQGFMHFFEGWVIFLLCILALIGLSKFLQFTARDKRSLPQVLDLDTSGLGTELARAHHVRPSAAMLGSAALFAVAATLWNPLTKPQPTDIAREPFLLFPRSLDEWRGAMNPDLPREITEILRADDYLSVSYDRPGGAAPVELFVAWHKDQTKAGIHSPEVCIPAAGWEMSKITQTEIAVDLADGPVTVPVNRAIIQKGLERQLVYYWFDQNGRRMTSDIAAKVWLTVGAIETGRMDGALIRLTTPIRSGEVVEAAEARLADMMRAAFPALPAFLGSTGTQAPAV